VSTNIEQKSTDIDKIYSPIGYLESNEISENLIDHCKEDLEIIFK
jgi:hypothetical protein